MQGEKNHGSRWKVLFTASAIICGAMSWAFLHVPKEKRRELARECSTESRRVFHSLWTFLVPHEANEFKPHIFRSRSVRHILLIVILIKVTVVTVLFMTYPNLARLDRDIRADMYQFINSYRADKGLPALVVNSYLEGTADNKAQDMLTNNYFSHFGPDGKKPWQWIDPKQYVWSAMGENLAMDFLTANSVFRAFQKSPAHDENLVNPMFSEIGIAVESGEIDTHLTQVMVVFFANPKRAVVKAIAAAPVLTTPTTNVPATTTPTPTTTVVQRPVPAPTQVRGTATSSPTKVIGFPATTTTSTGQMAANTESLRYIVEPVANPDVQLEVLGESIPETFIAVQNLNGGIRFAKGSFLQRVIGWADDFLLLILWMLVALMIVNISVKVRVQHAHIIANGLFLIVVIGVLLYTNVHQAEALGEQVRILGQWLH